MLQEVTSDELINRLRTDPSFGDLFVRTLESARTAGWEAKRQAMGRVVVQALRDDEAAIDDSGRLLSALNELEAPDFAALARLHETGLHRSPEKGIRLEEVEASTMRPVTPERSTGTPAASSRCWRRAPRIAATPMRSVDTLSGWAPAAIAVRSVTRYRKRTRSAGGSTKAGGHPVPALWETRGVDELVRPSERNVDRSHV